MREIEIHEAVNPLSFIVPLYNFFVLTMRQILFLMYFEIEHKLKHSQSLFKEQDLDGNIHELGQRYRITPY